MEIAITCLRYYGDTPIFTFVLGANREAASPRYPAENRATVLGAHPLAPRPRRGRRPSCGRVDLVIVPPFSRREKSLSPGLTRGWRHSPSKDARLRRAMAPRDEGTLPQQFCAWRQPPVPSNPTLRPMGTRLAHISGELIALDDGRRICAAAVTHGYRAGGFVAGVAGPPPWRAMVQPAQARVRGE